MEKQTIKEIGEMFYQFTFGGIVWWLAVFSSFGLIEADVYKRGLVLGLAVFIFRVAYQNPKSKGLNSGGG